MANPYGATTPGPGRGRGGRRKGKRRRSTAQRVVMVAGAVLAVLTLAGASVVGVAWWKWRGFDRVDVELDDVGSSEPVNFLFVGSDSRDAINPDDPDAGGFLDGEFGGKRSDTVMVARVDPGSGAVALLSIPRDLWLPIGAAGEYGEGRINAAYAEGPQVLVDTISANLGLPINHYVEVDFRGFKGLVDALGGIPLYFDQPMWDEYTGLDITEPGCVVLNGDQALAFARARHVEVLTEDGWVSDYTADLGRITRQQLFLRKALDKASSLGLGDVGKLNSLADVAKDNVSFDPGLSLTDAVRLGRKFSGFAGDQLQTFSLPTLDHTTDDGSAVLVLDAVAAEPVLSIFRGLTPIGGPAPGDGAPALTPAQVAVSVMNGTGIDGQASEAGDLLTTHGFAVAEVGDAGESTARSRLRFGSGQRAAAELVASVLVGGAELVEDPSVGQGVVLVTGSDFAGVTSVPETTLPPEVEGPAGADGATRTTTHVGFAPEPPPPGVSCG
ncbi:MAG: hypothetical protein GEV08_09620 [Acidimicrobiia bacterium]|nr:hypothetical protein [Acidimicrobiia bacterium]